jgi:hypothetical protein
MAEFAGCRLWNDENARRVLQSAAVILNPQDLINDLQESGLPLVAELQDRMKALELLQLPNSAQWPVPSFSDRIRLAPLLLYGMGRREDALSLANDFLVESVGRDQIIPPYHLFVEALRVAAEH